MLPCDININNVSTTCWNILFVGLDQYFLFFVDCLNLKNSKQVERFQDKAHCALKNYVESKHPNFPERFAKILLRLPATRMLTQRAAEELFFSPLIGTVKIESIMTNIISNSLRFWLLFLELYDRCTKLNPSETVLVY